ncbi:MAG TPA: flavodoxin family protein, partial [Caldimonas sp.]
LCHALADAYAEGASAQAHGVGRVNVAALDFPLLRGMADWDRGAAPAGDEPAQQPILRDLVLFYRLWLGGMPALLKGFLEPAPSPGWPRRAAKASSSAAVRRGLS